jgi:CBS domain-containing protein
VLRDMTARCAELAERSMLEDDWGAAPASWCVLLLGSGGRRESLFGADQDNAIIHAGEAGADPWFAELARRMNHMLDSAGVPLCKGDVMAQNPQWRHSVDGWRSEIARWMKDADGEELLNISIFCDFRPVYGDTRLAQTVRDALAEAAAHSPRFLHAMAGTVSRMGTALGVLGQFKTREGRLDLKLTGLLPLVSTVRLLALKHAITATGTAERLRALVAGNHMPAHEAERFIDGLDLMLRVLARQQVTDLADNIPLSNRIEPKRMPEDERHRLKDVFKSLGALHWVLNNALSTA